MFTDLHISVQKRVGETMEFTDITGLIVPKGETWNLVRATILHGKDIFNIHHLGNFL